MAEPKARLILFLLKGMLLNNQCHPDDSHPMIIEITTSILKRKEYWIPGTIFAAALFGISYYLMVKNVAFKSITIYAEMSGFWYTFFSLAMSLATAVLAGIYLALFIFRRQLIKEKKNLRHAATGAGGTATALLASGCPSCGAPIFALFGFPLALTSLPFRGLEIKLLSILLLALAIYLLAENIQKNLNCQIKPTL